MNRNKLFLFCFGAALLAIVSFGFYRASIDDGPNVVSFLNSGGEVMMTAPNSQQYSGDMPGTWSSGANIPSPGSYGGAGVSYTRNDTTFIYCINGDINGSGTATGDFRVYNVRTNVWTSLSTNTGRAWTSGARLGTYIYHFGGLPSGASSWSSMTGTLQRYSITAGTWTTMTAAPTPAGSSGFTGYQDSLLYAIGGMGTTGNPITNVQLYNQNSGTWRTATPLPVARANGWVWITGDTIYYGCGAGPTTTTYNNNIYKGVISQTDRATITWTTSSVTYPGTNRHRMDADQFGCFGCITGPGATATWWGQGNESYTWKGGTNAMVANPLLPTMTSDAMVGSGKFFRNGYDVWKFVVASGLIMSAPYHILNTQIFTDSCQAGAPPPQYGNTWCRNNINKTILDNTTIYDTIRIVGNTSCPIRDVNVKIDTVIHTWDGDLTFTLRHGATTVILVQNRGGSGDNFIGTILNDSAANPISSGSAPFTGSFRPEQPLTAFNTSHMVEGDWILSVNDNASGDTGLLKAWCITIYYDCPTGVGKIEIPSYYSLSQNYPNPFNPTTNIKYTLPKSEFVKLVVYDMTGREVKTLVNEYKQQGVYDIAFDGSALASGVYFYKIEAGSFVETKRMVLIK
jgi:subtilisin-like proprotein convertase family protein